MEIRDAVEADAEVLARIAGGPEDVLRNLVHDRTVRVAERDGEVVAFVSFDARPGTVYVTQLDGDPEAVEELVREPVRFAREEGMSVEVLVPEGAEEVREVLAGAGFDRSGRGPRFDDGGTVRYEYSP